MYFTAYCASCALLRTSFALLGGSQLRPPYFLEFFMCPTIFDPCTSCVLKCLGCLDFCFTPHWFSFLFLIGRLRRGGRGFLLSKGNDPSTLIVWFGVLCSTSGFRLDITRKPRLVDVWMGWCRILQTTCAVSSSV